VKINCFDNWFPNGTFEVHYWRMAKPHFDLSDTLYKKVLDYGADNGVNTFAGSLRLILVHFFKLMSNEKK
jgi:hypothetical protein